VSLPKERRLRTALVFSPLCLVAVFWASRAFDVHLSPDEGALALTMIVPALGLALMSVMASWLLVAELMERRPVFGDRQGRWLWLWTLVFSGTLLVLGVAGSASQTVGRTLLYASGLLAALIGGVGLVISAIPRWSRRAMGR
jgi:hypothetical protein